jgi:hypothetical protein
MKSYMQKYSQKLKTDIEMQYRLMIMRNWWEDKSKHYHISGSFNLDHYIRIMDLRMNEKNVNRKGTTKDQ